MPPLKFLKDLMESNIITIKNFFVFFLHYNRFIFERKSMQVTMAPLNEYIYHTYPGNFIID